jgi:predicted RNA methylase
MEELVELMKSRGIKRFVHFHTDHWEPFTGCGGEWGDMASENADVILRFIEETTNHPFFDKMTLFYNHPIRTSHHEVMDEDTKDMLYFEPIDDKFWERYEFAVRKVATDTNHEFQVHIHHEGVTTGEYFKWDNLPWQKGHEPSTTNSERFERYLKISLQELHRIVDLDLEKWHFLHGVWALNASDTDVCNVNDEIEILIRNGCIGDFSMPAGRSWVNSTTLAPHTVIPNNVPKGYDTEKADIKLIGENISKENKRFLIWNQEIPYSHCSIDLYGNDTIMEALENYMESVAFWIETSPIIGDTAFIKTHAHTMNRIFWENGGERPYDFPDVIRLFSTLKSVCEQADVDYEKWTVSEVITHLEKYDGALIGAFNRYLPPDSSRLIINDAIIPVAERRLKTMGETESGLYGYYAHRLSQMDFYDSDDASIMEFIWKEYSEGSRILEIAAGCGQVSFALERCGFEHIEFCEFDERRVQFSEDIKKSINSNCHIHSCDYRELDLQQYKLIFVMNAVSSALGAQDYELLADTVLSGTDVVLRFNKYGSDNKIFERLDADDRINYTNINFENTGERGIIHYSATNGV